MKLEEYGEDMREEQVESEREVVDDEMDETSELRPEDIAEIEECLNDTAFDDEYGRDADVESAGRGDADYDYDHEPQCKPMPEEEEEESEGSKSDRQRGVFNLRGP